MSHPVTQKNPIGANALKVQKRPLCKALNKLIFPPAKNCPKKKLPKIFQMVFSSLLTEGVEFFGVVETGACRSAPTLVRRLSAAQ